MEKQIPQKRCDSRALEECFKRHPVDRKIHCKAEIEAFELECAKKPTNSNESNCESCSIDKFK
jgi:hypothetical protein